MDLFNPDFADFITSLNKYKVRYMLVGGYAVVIRGFSRSTGDIDIFVDKTIENFRFLIKAIIAFGLPAFAIEEAKFFSKEFDVFSFGRPPYAIEILTNLKGISSFDEAYKLSTLEEIENISVRVIHLKHLIDSKKAAGRSKDKYDIENLPLSD
jgi:voltage-gated potassium channel Kch